MKHQKNILAFCTFLMSLLCFISLLHAQIHDSLSYAQHLRQKLSILDKTKAYTLFAFTGNFNYTFA